MPFGILFSESIMKTENVMSNEDSISISLSLGKSYP